MKKEYANCMRKCCRRYTTQKKLKDTKPEIWSWSGASNIATLNAKNQKLEGAVLVGSNSTLTLSLTEGSSFTGYIDGNITNASGNSVSTSAGTVSVTLDSTSTWTLTADSYVTSFSGNAENVKTNGYTLYVNGTALTGTATN